jgi:hypothetical protein
MYRELCFRTTGVGARMEFMERPVWVALILI